MPTPQWGLPFWTEGSFTAATPCSLPIFSQRIPGLSDNYVLTQDFMQFEADYFSAGPQAVGTAHPSSGLTPDYSAYKLIEETDFQDMGGGVIRWTRRYAKTPPSHWEPQGFSYPFIGLQVDLGGGASQTRDRQSWPVQSRIKHDYFRLGSSVVDPILLGSAVTINNDYDIPTILPMYYCAQGTIGGVVYGGVSLAVPMLNMAASLLPTWPTSEQYQTMIGLALQYGWGTGSTISKIFLNSTTTGAHVAGTIDTTNSVRGGIIPAEMSVVDRWIGDIFVRKTRYILAE